MATDFIDSREFVLSTAAATNTQDITITDFGTADDIIGFIIFATGLVTADDTITANGDLSIGFCDGTNQYVQQYIATDNVATTVTRRLQRSDAVIYHVDTSGTLLHAFSFTEFITDGIRLTIDNQAAAAYKCTLILIRGDTGSNCFVGVKDDLGTTGTATITGVGFTSDWITMCQAGNNAALPNSSTQGILSLGMWITGDSQGSCAIGSNNGAGETTGHAWVSDAQITGQNISAARQYGSTLGNVVADGFDMVNDASAGNDIVGFICVKWGGSPETAIFPTTIPTVSPYAETGAGFTNTTTFGFISSLDGVTGFNTLATTNTFGLSIAAFNGTTVQTINVTSEDTADPTVEKTVHNTAFKMYSEDGSTTEVVASSITLDAAGWDMVLSTTPAAALLGFGFAFAEVSTAAAALTGTATDTINEDDITDGGKTVIITLTGDTYKAAGTGPIGSTADTQALIDGFDAATSPTNGWNNEVRDKAATSEVVRTSSTIATWTVVAQAGYDISAQETITGTIPTDVLVTGAGAITATPTFTIDPVSAGGYTNALSLMGVG